MVQHLLEDEDDDILDAGDTVPDSTDFGPGDTTDGWLERVMPLYGFKRECTVVMGRNIHGWVKENGLKKVFVSKARWNPEDIDAHEFVASCGGEWKHTDFYTVSPGIEATDYLKGNTPVV